MSKPKKEYIPLHIKADAAVMRRFEDYCNEMGQTKTLALERILMAFLDEHDEKIKEKE